MMVPLKADEIAHEPAIAVRHDLDFERGRASLPAQVVTLREIPRDREKSGCREAGDLMIAYEPDVSVGQGEGSHAVVRRRCRTAV
jgi:hypothetical protein